MRQCLIGVDDDIEVDGASPVSSGTKADKIETKGKAD